MTADGSSRIVSLDIIRGVAVMGIFSVNVIAFAMIEQAYGDPATYGGATGADLVVWAANMVLIEGKMRALFSMLFGASTLLIIERSEAAGSDAWATHSRRMVVLFLFGLAHFYFVWTGDILHLYAVIGLLAFAFRDAPSRILLRWAIGLMLVQILLFALLSMSIYQADWAAHAPGASAQAVTAWNDGAGRLMPSPQIIAADLALYRDGFLARLGDAFGPRRWDWGNDIIAFGPETLSLMLFGMAGYKSGFFTGDWSDAAYRKAAAVGLGIGAIAFAVLVAIDIRTGFRIPVVIAVELLGSAPFRPLMAFGYAALIILATRRGGWLAARLAAVGRVAFTNYLGTSIVAASVFYGWGLGLYGHASRAQAWLLVPIVWVMMLAWSKPWLDRFHYGPFEWAWRSLARGKVQPMRKLLL